LICLMSACCLIQEVLSMLQI